MKQLFSKIWTLAWYGMAQNNHVDDDDVDDGDHDDDDEDEGHRERKKNTQKIEHTETLTLVNPIRTVDNAHDHFRYISSIQCLLI